MGPKAFSKGGEGVAAAVGLCRAVGFGPGHIELVNESVSVSDWLLGTFEGLEFLGVELDCGASRDQVGGVSIGSHCVVVLCGRESERGGVIGWVCC